MDALHLLLSHPSLVLLSGMQEKAGALGCAGALKVGVLGWEVPFLTPQLGTWSISQYGRGE